MDNNIDFNKPDEERKHQTGNGIQKVWRFDNGYGASVVQFKILGTWGSYSSNENEWELAVIKFCGKGIGDFVITYDTHITKDVVGHLTPENVLELLKKVRALKK